MFCPRSILGCKWYCFPGLIVPPIWRPCPWVGMADVKVHISRGSCTRKCHWDEFESKQIAFYKYYSSPWFAHTRNLQDYIYYWFQFNKVQRNKIKQHNDYNGLKKKYYQHAFTLDLSLSSKMHMKPAKYFASLSFEEKSERLKQSPHQYSVLKRLDLSDQPLRLGTTDSVWWALFSMIFLWRAQNTIVRL